jgi:hypothetical protein
VAIDAVTVEEEESPFSPRSDDSEPSTSRAQTEANVLTAVTIVEKPGDSDSDDDIPPFLK